MNIYPKPTPAPSTPSTNPFPFFLDDDTFQTANEPATPVNAPKPRDANAARKELEYVQSQLKEGDVINIPVKVSHITYSKQEGVGPVAVKVVALGATTSTQHKVWDTLWLDTDGASFRAYKDRILAPDTDTFGFPHSEMLLATADFLVRYKRDQGTLPTNTEVASAVGHPGFPSTDQDNAIYVHWQITPEQRTAWLREFGQKKESFYIFSQQAIAVAMGNVGFANPSVQIQELVGNCLSSKGDQTRKKVIEKVMGSMYSLLDSSDPSDVLTFVESKPLGVALGTIRFPRGGFRSTQEIFNAWVDNLLVAFEASTFAKASKRKTLEAQIKAAVEAGDYARVGLLASELTNL